ncbi:Cytochrome protein, partial [Ophiophagus hannah]
MLLLHLPRIFSAYSLDVVTSTSFSVNIDSLNHPNDLMVVHMKKFLRFSLLSPVLILAVLFPFLIPVLDKFNLTIFPRSSVDFFFNVLKKIKEDRQKKGRSVSLDFFDSCLLFFRDLSELACFLADVS